MRQILVALLLFGSVAVALWRGPTTAIVAAAFAVSGVWALAALWVLLATTGMRRGEALALRWSDVDLTAGRVTVVRTASWVGKRA